jgi:transposase-like protein
MTKRKVAQPDLSDLLLADYRNPEDLIGENRMLKQRTKAIVARALPAELAAQLGHDQHEAGAKPATPATAAAPGPATAISVPCPSTFRATAMAASNRSGLPDIRPAAPAATTRSCRCMRSWTKSRPGRRALRKVIDTTNAIESGTMRLRKVTPSSGSFPNDDALVKRY